MRALKRKELFYFNFICGFSLLLSQSTFAIPACEKEFCASVKSEIDPVCLEIGLKGYVFPIIGPKDQLCTCVCGE